MAPVTFLLFKWCHFGWLFRLMRYRFVFDRGCYRFLLQLVGSFRFILWWSLVVFSYGCCFFGASSSLVGPICFPSLLWFSPSPFPSVPFGSFVVSFPVLLIFLAVSTLVPRLYACRMSRWLLPSLRYVLLSFWLGWLISVLESRQFLNPSCSSLSLLFFRYFRSLIDAVFFGVPLFARRFDFCFIVSMDLFISVSFILPCSIGPVWPISRQFLGSFHLPLGFFFFGPASTVVDWFIVGFSWLPSSFWLLLRWSVDLFVGLLPWCHLRSLFSLPTYLRLVHHNAKFSLLLLINNF